MKEVWTCERHTAESTHAVMGPNPLSVAPGNMHLHQHLQSLLFHLSQHLLERCPPPDHDHRLLAKGRSSFFSPSLVQMSLVKAMWVRNRRRRSSPHPFPASASRGILALYQACEMHNINLRGGGHKDGHDFVQRFLPDLPQPRARSILPKPHAPSRDVT